MPREREVLGGSGENAENTGSEWENLAEGVKTLTKTGFHERHKEIVDSSLKKATARGEKFTGNSGMRRNMAYVHRLEERIEERGNELEQRLWAKSVEKLIIEPEDIQESYWRRQEQILRDNGQGDWKMNDMLKEVATRDLQGQQRASLETWAKYLGDENAPYSMWFKLYAWDGMSKMGVFNKDTGEFKKRDIHTTAPYPRLNQAALAKVYEAVNGFYKGESEYTKDEKLEALIQSGNFNKLYSKFLLEQKAILPTPERTEDVRGEWVEYSPGQEEKVAKAAEGTPWCVASASVAKGYLRSGKYHDLGNEYDQDDTYDNEEDVSRSKAKFILFHLLNPETNVLSETACASVRLDTDGYVAEVSGLKEGQALEDALVPIVEEKVRSLPGGERFLEAFADKQMLIQMDRKMQAGEKLTKEEVEFIFETEREIVMLDTYNDRDPRIVELQWYAGDNLSEEDFRDLSGRVPGSGILKDVGEARELEKIDKKIESGEALGEDEIDLVFNAYSRTDQSKLSMQAEKIRVKAILGGLISAPKRIERVLYMMDDEDMAENLGALKGLGLGIDRIGQQMRYPGKYFLRFVEEWGTEAEVLLERGRVGAAAILQNEQALRDSELDFVELMNATNRYRGGLRLDDLARGTNIDASDSDAVRHAALAKIEQYIEEGVKVDKIAGGIQTDSTIDVLWELSDMGLSDKVLKELIERASVPDSILGDYDDDEAGFEYHSREYQETIERHYDKLIAVMYAHGFSVYNIMKIAIHGDEDDDSEYWTENYLFPKTVDYLVDTHKEKIAEELRGHAGEEIAQKFRGEVELERVVWRR